MTSYLYSLLLHAALVAIGIAVVRRGELRPAPKPVKVAFKVIEEPVTKKTKPQAIPPPPLKKPVELDRQPVKRKRKKPARKVFGVSKHSITSKRGTAPIVKRGNTIATEVDQKKLRKDDEEELPLPQAEYLITTMPTVISEAKITYPKGERREGTVLLSVLIDAQGKVRAVSIIEGLTAAMNKEALHKMKQYRFNPGKIDNVPVAVRIRYAIKFVLENN